MIKGFKQSLKRLGFRVLLYSKLYINNRINPIFFTIISCVFTFVENCQITITAGSVSPKTLGGALYE
jgi:hypothetical protein